jgi:recombination protein RecR
VYFLLGRNPEYIGAMSDALHDLKKEMAKCSSCMRYFTKKGGGAELCSICSDGERDAALLMLVAKDTDLLSVEKAGIFNGYYFVIGGLIPILEKNPEQRIRTNELSKCVKKRAEIGLKEIIIALSATNEGENTSLFIEKILSNEMIKNNIKITHLGRGLSTGAELEYADTDTIKAALENKR